MSDGKATHPSPTTNMVVLLNVVYFVSSRVVCGTVTLHNHNNWHLDVFVPAISITSNNTNITLHAECLIPY